MTRTSTRARRITEGLCVDCGDTPRPGMRHCHRCADVRRVWRMKRTKASHKTHFEKTRGSAEWEEIGADLGVSKQAAHFAAKSAMEKLMSRTHRERVQWRLANALRALLQAEAEGADQTRLRELYLEVENMIGAVEFLDAIADGSLEERLAETLGAPSVWDRMVHCSAGAA